MKLRRSMPQSTIGHVNVTPLIDIVMVLIVFFMLVARIGISTGAEPMRLPQSIRGIKIEDMGNTLTLNLRTTPAGPTLSALVAGKKETLSLLSTGPSPTLLDTLRYFRFGPDPASPRDDNPNFKVILRADKDLPYEVLQPVLQACAEAQVKNVNFTTEMVLEEK